MVAVKTVLKKTSRISRKGFDIAGRFVIWCAGIFLLLLILLQFAFWGAVIWLNSSSGQNMVQQALGQALEGTQTRIVIGGMSYIFPTNVHLGRVTIYQRDEKYTELEGLDLGVDIFALSRRELPIYLHAKNVTLYEIKEQPPKDVKAQPIEFPILVEPLTLPELPFDRVFLHDISIDDLVIKGANDIALSPALSGQIEFFTGELVSLDLVYKDTSKNADLPQNVKIRGQYHPSKSLFHLTNISVSAPQYSVSGKAVLNFSDGGDLSLDVLAQANGVNDLSPVSVKLKAVNNRDFIANLTVNGRYQEYAIDVQTSAKAIGNQIHLNPISVKLPEIAVNGNIAIDTVSSILSGSVSGKLDSINPYRTVIGNDHALSPVNFNLNLSEETGRQKISFKAKIDLYQNIPSGLTFNDLEAQGILLGQNLNITSITAKDANNGTFNANAQVDLNTMGVDVSVSARDLNAVQGEIASAIVNMDMNIKGQDEAYIVKGEIRPVIVNVKLPERFSANIPQINIVEPSTEQGNKKQEMDILSNITIDIDVNAPSQIFVRGWGLDSEFGGNIKIKGFADDPKFDGSFSIIRGRYSEFGRSFKLKKGELVFAGSIPPFPKLDIIAETKTGDVLARIEIKGTPENPKITFGSEPALPEDEVLSHILFGKNMDSITPFQAVKLTQTLQRFSGQGGAFSSFDPLDTVRAATGLDDLRVEADEEGEATVGAGKYLSENVYLEFETGSGDTGSNANIEIELTPNITVESEIGEDAQGGAGIFWKWDY